MPNLNFTRARKARNDEFYTQFNDIQAEMNAYIDYNPDVFRGKTVLLPCDDPEQSNFTKFFVGNFDRFGLKRLVSTSYVPEEGGRGKLFVLEEDVTQDGRRNMDDLVVSQLSGNGDFRSEEVRALRDSADIIVTNPPFSLFREFVAWIMEAEKQFIIIGNMNAITYKEVFPLIKNNKMWMGTTGFVTDMVFGVPEGAIVKESDKQKAERLGYIGNYTRMGNTCWFTNVDHGRRHQPLKLMTMADNFKHSKHKEIRGRTEYVRYDNYDAIEVPFTDAIPSDYDGAMGVPVSFIDKYCPEQFEILGITLGNTVDYEMTALYTNAIQHNKDGSTQGGGKVNTRAAILVKEAPANVVYYTADNADGYLVSLYPRILIRKKKPQ